MIAQELSGKTEENNSGEVVENDSSRRVDTKDNDCENENGVTNDLIEPVIQTVNEEDITCGLPFWRPEWLQRLPSKKTYALVYGLLGMSHAAIDAYFIGTISSIEKRFKLPSTTTGVISSSWDIGTMSAVMVMAYFGNGGHKTRWVAACAILTGLSCYMRYIPHLMYGPGANSSIYDKSSNSTGNMCNDENVMPENCSLNSEGMFTFIILTLAHITLGIGTSSYDTLGAAYLDDNALKNKFPILLAITTCLMYFGPTLGYLMASYTLSNYIDPEVVPPFGEDDPRWIGAWSMGWLHLGTMHVFLAVLMAFFPKILPREAQRRISSGIPLKQAKKNKSLQDFKTTLLRLVKNPVLMLNTASSTFYVFGMMGYWIFMPKYIETQFRQTASAASLITGTVGLVCTAIGVLASGAIVSRFRPRPQYLAAWNIFTETVDILGHASFAFLGCYKGDLAGSELDGKWNLIQSCNSNCSCTGRLSYAPVCSQDLTTYYSPCHAGCSEFGIINNTKTYFDCSCIESGIAVDGACPFDCNNHFYIFIFLLCFMEFLSATKGAGNTIIQLRSVAPEDKSIAIALLEVVVCAFAYMPAPIIYGMLLDWSCLIWGETCGTTGNCWLYDGKTLRYLLNFTASGLLLMATIMDVGVLCKVGKLKIYDEDDKDENKNVKNDDERNEEPLLENKENET